MSRITARAVHPLLALAALAAVPAQAAPNGLTQIPIAKVFGDGVASFSVARSVENSQTTTYTAQYGLGNRLEVGVDDQDAPSDQRTLLGNVKFLVGHAPGRLPDIALGMTNIATGQQAAPYAVATTQPGALGLSLGVVRPSGGSATVGMAGLAYNLTPTVQLVADTIQGHDGYGTLGVIAALGKTVSLNVAYAAPNSADGARGYVVSLDYTFHLKPGESGAGGPENKNQAAGHGQ